MLKTIILAAGQGKRMQSARAKVLHRLAGKPMLEHVIDNAQQLSPEPLSIVIGHNAEQIQQAINHDVNWVLQTEQLGTGHAVQQALPQIGGSSQVLVLYGDVPLLSTETLKEFIAAVPETALGILTAEYPDPFGFGRIVRDENNQITAIVEHKDASDAELEICEINTGVMLLPAAHLSSWLQQLDNDNSQQEFYLTDVVKLARAQQIDVLGLQVENITEVAGVNSLEQLAELEREFQFQCAREFMHQGVTFADPMRVDFRGDVHIGQDTFVDVNTLFIGDCKIGKNCQIGPNCYLKDVTIADGVVIEANSHLEGTVIAAQSTIGPFARLRSGTEIAAKAKVGNFVELKNTKLGAGSKANHLSYLGDATIGAAVNIGAGTITCNYDGKAKHPTTIADSVQIGSNCQIVAPISIGEGAYVAAGTTVIKDAPAFALTYNRIEQHTKAEWTPPMQRERN